MGRGGQRRGPRSKASSLRVPSGLAVLVRGQAWCEGGTESAVWRVEPGHVSLPIIREEAGVRKGIRGRHQARALGVLLPRPPGTLETKCQPLTTSDKLRVSVALAGIWPEGWGSAFSRVDAVSPAPPRR